MLGDSPGRRLCLGGIAALLMCMFVTSTASASTLHHAKKHKHKKGHTALAASDALTLDSLQAEIVALQAQIQALLGATTVATGTTTPVTVADGTTFTFTSPAATTVVVNTGPPATVTITSNGVTVVISFGGSQRSPCTLDGDSPGCDIDGKDPKVT